MRKARRDEQLIRNINYLLLGDLENSNYLLVEFLKIEPLQPLKFNMIKKNLNFQLENRNSFRDINFLLG